MKKWKKKILICDFKKIFAPFYSKCIPCIQSTLLVYGKICDCCDCNEFTKVSKEVTKNVLKTNLNLCWIPCFCNRIWSITRIIFSYRCHHFWLHIVCNLKKKKKLKNWKKPKVFELYFQNILWYLPVVWIHKQILLQVTGRQTLKAQRWNRPVTEVSSPEKKIIEKVKDILDFRLSIFFWPKAVYLIAGFLITFWHNVFNPFLKDNF